MNACGRASTIGRPAVPRPIYTDPEIASVGLTEAQAREAYGSDIAVGKFPWLANARAVMQNETAGWVKSIHHTRTGELLGLVMIGPHVTDMVEAGVIAIDAEVTEDIIADGMAPHPTLSEAIKGALLVALRAGDRRAQPKAASGVIRCCRAGRAVTHPITHQTRATPLTSFGHLTRPTAADVVRIARPSYLYH